MFKAARWRNEKNKITAVFRLQFHVTQVSGFGGNGLVLSLVPAENGKPTAKLEKCSMRESSCYWDNPVFETVKFIQDPKSGKIFERIYYFIISTGSPKGSLVGEFSVNMADYVAAAKACSISFPFKNKPDAHLHVSIQRVQEDGHQRNIEENEVPKITMEDRSLRRHFSNGDMEEGIMTDSVENEPLRKTVSQLPGLSGMRRGSSGSDITLSSSDSSSGLDTPREAGLRNYNSNRDQASNGLSQQDQQRTQWDLAIVPVNDLTKSSLLSSPRDAFSVDGSQMASDESVEKLKGDLFACSRRQELLELELQTLRKQIVKETKKGQDMLKEIYCLKEERDVLKDECKKLKTSQPQVDDLKAKSKSQFEGNQWTVLEEIREELNYEKDLNTNLRLQLQKTQESNAELILAVQDLEEMLGKSNRSCLSNRSASGEITALKCESDDDEEQKALEELVRQHSDAQETYMLEQKVMDLCSELEMYRRDKDELEIQMEQLALDYEILKQENHEFSNRLEQCHLREQLKMQNGPSSSHVTIVELQAQREKLQREMEEQSRELSHCLATVKELEARKHSLEDELKKQIEGSKADEEAVAHSLMVQEKKTAQAEEALCQSAATINELETEIHKLRTEINKLSEELSNCFASINELEAHNRNLEDELRKQAEGFKADKEALIQATMELEQRALQAEKTVALSTATINELDSHIKELENEVKTHSEDSADTVAKFKELEASIQNLEDELEKQAEGFEADLEAVTCAKVEQEKRAIRAEEALRSLRWKNANTAAKIQDEFKRLSKQMQSSFEINEKLAIKASTEASELCLQNRHLHDMLLKANEELQSAKGDYETKVQELNDQINIKTTQLEQLLAELDAKSKEFENQRKHADEFQKTASAQHLELGDEIEKLTSENKLLAEQVKKGENLGTELEQMKALIKERDMFVQEENMESGNLELTVGWMEEQAGKSLMETSELRYLTDEKEQNFTNLHAEVENLRAQCDNLKHSLYEDELEKENLRKQVFQLKTDLKKKDEVISSIEKKSKDNSVHIAVQDRSRATSKNTKSEPLQRGSKEIGAKEVATLKERIKLLEGQVKLKEANLETSVNAFLSKERDLNGKIEELEIRLREDGQRSSESNLDVVEEKVSVGMQAECIAEEVTSTGDIPEASIGSENLNNMKLKNSEVESLFNTQPETSGENSGEQQKFDILLKETVLVKERNKSMEIELKEMQERYSEISLKFAEVEGERQQLVMTLRNLKNAMKS